MITRGRKKRSISEVVNNDQTNYESGRVTRSSKRKLIASPPPVTRSKRLAAKNAPPPNIIMTRLRTKAQSQKEPETTKRTRKPSDDRPSKPVAEAESKAPTLSIRIPRNRGKSEVKKTTPPKKIGRPRNDSKADNSEETFWKTFGHKLTLTEADTTRGTPTENDRELFKQAQAMAESKEPPKRRASSSIQKEGESSSSSQKNDRSTLAIPKIDRIQFGDYSIDTWFVAPYPEEYSQYPLLHICEYCLKYMKSSFVAGRHKMKCPMKHPPGNEIYRDGNISIFEVDGRKNKIYCQNLCLMAKMFLDHKTLYYDVEPFLFYIMTEVDERGCHFVGYFSKEKRSAMNYNVSCILTLPVHQRKGYGQYLIEFSYLLSKKEAKTGSPEKPLSDLGLLSYRSYWKTAIFRELQHQEGPVSIEELSNRTSMTVDDVISVLQACDMLKRDAQKRYYLEVNPEVIDAHLRKVEQRKLPRVDPSKLTWTPFVLSRDRLASLMGQQTVTKDTEETADVDVTGDENSEDENHATESTEA